jgi:hypothetical protein
MRPYAAVIKDSFREALASRVLWVLTGVIVLVLLALAPLGYRLNLSGEFSWGDISEGTDLAASLRQAGNSPTPSPGRRIWSLFDEETRTRVEKMETAAEAEQGRDYERGLEALRRGLNKLVSKSDLYTKEDWQGVTLPKEARELLERPRDSLAKDEQARLNRLLIETVSPGSFASRSPYSTVVTYFWAASEPLPFSKNQVDTFVKQWILPTVMGWIVGVFGMIAAILVTSTIIPQMFEPGSITLLLSKPVSRSLLLSAKFLGGCAFVLINVTLLICGLWLIAGWRFGIWNYGMLWCIPVFLFMFLIYYAVSALTGLVWKSAIISVVVTVLFWIACFVVDFAHGIMQGMVLEQQRISRIVEADGSLLTMNEATRLQTWDEEGLQWRPVADPRGGPGIPIVVGPYYHAPSKQLLIGQGFRNPFGGRQQRISLKIASASGGWKPADGPALPGGTSSFVVTADDTIYAIASDNIFRFQGDPATKGATVNMFGFRLPIVGGGTFAPAIDGDSPPLPDPIAAAADAKEPRLMVAAANDVYLFRQQEGGGLQQVARYLFESQEAEGSAVAIAGNLAVVAREDGKVWLLSADDLSVKQTLSLEPSSQPRFAVAAADSSRIAVLFQNRKLWFIDTSTGEATRAPVAPQGEISGLAWSGDRLLVADYANRVVAYDAQTFSREGVYRSPLTRSEIGFYYIIQPLYTIFPKPRMLNNTVQYLLTGKRTTDMGLFQGNLAQQREDLEPWKPVRSGLAFVAVVLVIACFYIERHEF